LLVNSAIHGVTLFLIPEQSAGIEACATQSVICGSAKTEKEVGKMITLTSGWKMTVAGTPAFAVRRRPAA
jgi:hypothetical protein